MRIYLLRVCHNLRRMRENPTISLRVAPVFIFSFCCIWTGRERNPRPLVGRAAPWFIPALCYICPGQERSPFFLATSFFRFIPALYRQSPTLTCFPPDKSTQRTNEIRKGLSGFLSTWLYRDSRYSTPCKPYSICRFACYPQLRA